MREVILKETAGGRVTCVLVVSRTEKYRPKLGIEPRASRLTYERATTELSRSYTFLLFKFGVLSNYPSIELCVHVQCVGYYITMGLNYNTLYIFLS